MEAGRQGETGRGRFLVLDGIDGCGKSTQARMLIEQLGARAVAEARPEPLHLREPGSTALGERLRELLLAGDAEINPGSEVMLFASARRQLLSELVEPALASGRDVVCERFHPATLAYQAHAGELDGYIQGILQCQAGSGRQHVRPTAWERR